MSNLSSQGLKSSTVQYNMRLSSLAELPVFAQARRLWTPSACALGSFTTLAADPCRDIGQQEVLSEIAGSIGLDKAVLEQALKDGKYSAAHKADLREAGQLGISSVPTFVATGSRRVAASGVLPKDAILDLIKQAS